MSCHVMSAFCPLFSHVGMNVLNVLNVLNVNSMLMQYNTTGVGHRGKAYLQREEAAATPGGGPQSGSASFGCHGEIHRGLGYNRGGGRKETRQAGSRKCNRRHTTRHTSRVDATDDRLVGPQCSTNLPEKTHVLYTHDQY